MPHEGQPETRKFLPVLGRGVSKYQGKDETKRSNVLWTGDEDPPTPGSSLFVTLFSKEILL